MKVSETALLESGFTYADLRIIKNNIESYGGSLDEAIQDLANRFRIVLWVFYGCLAVFIMTMLTKNQTYVTATGISLIITMLIVIFVQPPVLSYKSWRYWRLNRTNVR